MLAQIAPVIRKIKCRHTVHEQHGVPHLDVFFGNNFYVTGTDVNRRVAHIIGRDQGVARVVGFIGRVALQLPALREHRRLARAKLFALHLVRFEIIADVFAGPD